MVFIVRGILESRQSLRRGFLSTSALGPGGFFGDELLSWCLRRPFVDRLPSSSSSFVCIKPAEAFALDAGDIRYIADHFRYKFANERLRRTARYYSHNWRTWAAVNIQLAWRRHRAVKMRRPARRLPPEQRLRLCAAMFMSLKPRDHL